MAVRSKFLDRIDLGRIVDLIRFLLLLPPTKLLSQLICFHEKKTPEGEWKVNRIPAALHFCSAFLSREQQKKKRQPQNWTIQTSCVTRSFRDGGGVKIKNTPAAEVTAIDMHEK